MVQDDIASEVTKALRASIEANRQDEEKSRNGPSATGRGGPQSFEFLKADNHLTIAA